MQQESDKEVNYVHQSTIMTETIKKELKHQKLFVKYGINPFKKVCPLADNPNRAQNGDEEDKHFLEVLERAALEPTKRYTEPQTENQEYGWISEPLMEIDRSDIRFYYPKQSCEMTRFMEALWKQKEQRKLNQ
ncbi:hypothetical protein FBUS_08457 [Fasciolopsis buskii]|uniref:Protein FAM183A n=1 Tax=Fasciolopsis buskii TaxID=27845 RepID=A0A8E0S1E5_9TREM|nr:hypothetical protein FBUS_08457 [Fasciolopsis buski]